MKRLILTLAIFINLISLFSQDVRNVSWGMNIIDVQSSETLTIFKRLDANANNTVLVYKDQIFGDSIYVWYQFLYDSLSSVMYQYYRSSTMEESYDKMLRLVNLLTTKYSEPKEIIWNCKDPDIRNIVENAENQNQELEYLFFAGDITGISYKWVTDRSFISLVISSENLNVQGRNFIFPAFSIIYKSHNYDRLLQMSQNEYLQNKF
ncbi:MAG: hypothetical protein JRJ57_08390 [Deltaproteobacteria bacterium]|nr:hypothetical protein [Deltaproteobacteria bacterium]